MKTIKQSMLVLAASFAATVSFAQVGLGVANSTHATVSKAVNVNATTQVAAHAATRVANATKSTTSATTAATKTTLKKGSQTAADVKSTAKENARVNAQANVHASEQVNANENSAVFGTKTDAGSQTDASVNVDSKKTLDKAEYGATKVKTKAGMETRTKSQAALHASETAKEHANENSAVLDANAGTSNSVKVDKKGTSSSSEAKAATKGQVKKG